MLKFSLLFAFSLSSLACNSDKTNIKKNFAVIISDTSITHRPNYELEFSKEQSDNLNLPYIFNGVDSFELRIWSYSMWTRKDLLILRYLKDKWVLTEYEYYTNENLVDSLQSNSKQILYDSISGIKNLLESDSLLNLPSQFQIPGFWDNTADGVTYHLEIATKKFYKFLSYHNPAFFKDKYNRFFQSILDALNSKLNHTYFLPEGI